MLCYTEIFCKVSYCEDIWKIKSIRNSLIACASIQIMIQVCTCFMFRHYVLNSRFDIVMNCGGREVLRFSRPKHIAAQRAVETPLQSFIDIGDVSLVPLDTKVGPVYLFVINFKLIFSRWRWREGIPHNAFLANPTGTCLTMEMWHNQHDITIDNSVIKLHTLLIDIVLPELAHIVIMNFLIVGNRSESIE